MVSLLSEMKKAGISVLQQFTCFIINKGRERILHKVGYGIIYWHTDTPYRQDPNLGEDKSGL